MNGFSYQDGSLRCEKVSAARIAEQAGTPCYVYSRASLLGRFAAIRDAFAALDTVVCYAVKANGNINILRLLAEAGSGFDVVSGGELARVLEAGGDPGKICFAGVGKTDAEIHAGLDAGIRHFNVESRGELERIDAIAKERGVRAPVAFRVNPDVDPETHEYITTGKAENKFGIALDTARALAKEYARAPKEASAPGIELVGLHAHIGSQVTNPAKYVSSLRVLLALRDELAPHGAKIASVNLGGGFSITYAENEGTPASAYADAVGPLLKDAGLTLELEPGRWIAGPSGVLLTRVLYVKEQGSKRFAVVDAAMNDLLRPSLYGSHHPIWPVAASAGPAELAEGEPGPKVETNTYDVVGPICETGDFLAKDRALPPVNPGDLLAVFCAGAYGLSMASNYNSRGRPPEVLVDGEALKTIRRRETYEDLVALERM